MPWCIHTKLHSNACYG